MGHFVKPVILLSILSMVFLTVSSAHSVSRNLSSKIPSKKCEKVFENIRSAYRHQGDFTAEQQVKLNQLQKDLGINPEDVHFTKTHQIPVVIRGIGLDEANAPIADFSRVVTNEEVFDSVIVGGGLSGLTAGIYLTDAGKKVLILEQLPEFGGLASGGHKNSFEYARGSAYFSPPNRATYKVLQHIGLGDYKKHFTIREPIDSYFWKGVTYKGVWEEETLKKLPKSFALFKRMLQKANSQIPVQPMEEATQALKLDNVTALDWVRSVPMMAAQSEDPQTIKIYKEFLEDPNVNRADPMADVTELLNLYTRSALGGRIDEVSTVAFLNFYSSEIGIRYTGTKGTGSISDKMASILQSRESLATLSGNSRVEQVRTTKDGVEVFYTRSKTLYRVRAKSVVYAAPSKTALKTIKDFSVMAPEHAAILNELEYANYTVHNVFVEGEPWKDPYDLWLNPKDVDASQAAIDPTDVILGRWMESPSNVKTTENKISVLSIYHPLPKRFTDQEGYSKGNALENAEMAATRLNKMLEKYLEQNFGTSIKIKMIETNLWPYAVHVTKPGWLSQAKTLRKPIGGNIFLSNNNLGTPSFEEAIYRGKKGAESVLKLLKKDLSAD